MRASAVSAESESSESAEFQLGDDGSADGGDDRGPCASVAPRVKDIVRGAPVLPLAALFSAASAGCDVASNATYTAAAPVSFGAAVRVAHAAGKIMRKLPRKRKALAVRMPPPSRKQGIALLVPPWDVSQTCIMYDTCARARAAAGVAQAQAGVSPRGAEDDVDDCGGGWRRCDDPYGGAAYWHNARSGALSWSRPYGAFDEEGGRAVEDWQLVIGPPRWVSVLLCTVTYYANRAHNLTRSP